MTTANDLPAMRTMVADLRALGVTARATDTVANRDRVTAAWRTWTAVADAYGWGDDAADAPPVASPVTPVIPASTSALVAATGDTGAPVPTTTATYRGIVPSHMARPDIPDGRPTARTFQSRGVATFTCATCGMDRPVTSFGTITGRYTQSGLRSVECRACRDGRPRRDGAAPGAHRTRAMARAADAADAAPTTA